MTDTKKALEMAIEALKAIKVWCYEPDTDMESAIGILANETLCNIQSCKEALEQEQSFAEKTAQMSFMSLWDAYTTLKMKLEALEQPASKNIRDSFNEMLEDKVAYYKGKHPAQEPVAWMEIKEDAGYKEIAVWQEPVSKQSIPLYTHPAPSQWISVDDKLPKFVTVTSYEKSSDDVLILIDEKHLYIGSYIWDLYSQETEFCMRDLDGGYEGVGDMNVTHWMPLPNVPKEQ